MGTDKKGFIYFLQGFLILSSSFAFGQSSDQQTVSVIDSARALTFQYITANPKKASEQLIKAEIIADSLGEKEAQADILASLSISKNYLGDWDESIEYRIKSITIYEEIGMDIEAGYGFTELGWGVRRRDLDRAEYFMSRGIEILKNSPTSEELSNAYNNYGIIKLEQGKIDSAIILINKSLDIKQQNKDTLGIAYSYGYLGSAYQEQQKYDIAIQYLVDSFDLKDQMGDSSGMAIDLTNIASVYSEQGDIKSAIDNFRASLLMALKIEYHQLTEYNYGNLSGLFESQAMYDSALHYQKQFNAFREERVNESTNARLAELEVQFETEQKEKDLALRSAELSQEQLKVRQQNWILSALGGLFLFGSFITGLFFRQQKIKRENLKRENHLEIQLAQAAMENKIHLERERISRDLHDNVGSQISNLITGIEIGNLHIKKDQQDQAANILSALDKDARSAMTDLRETIWLMDKDKIDFSQFVDHIKEYVGKQQRYLEDMKADVVSSVEKSFSLNPTISLNLMRIIQESLNNAKKYSSADCIQILFEQNGDSLNVIIKDNGSGFDVEKSKHNGYGLTNMQKRADNMGADFQLESSPGQETKITLSIPDIP